MSLQAKFMVSAGLHFSCSPRGGSRGGSVLLSFQVVGKIQFFSFKTKIPDFC